MIGTIRIKHDDTAGQSLACLSFIGRRTIGRGKPYFGSRAFENDSAKIGGRHANTRERHTL